MTRQILAHVLLNSKKGQVLRRQAPRQRAFAHAERPRHLASAGPSVRQEQSDGVFHAGAGLACRIGPPGQGLLAVLDEQLIEIALGLGEPKLRGPAGEGDLIMLGGKGHFAAEEGPDLT